MIVDYHFDAPAQAISVAFLHVAVTDAGGFIGPDPDPCGGYRVRLPDGVGVKDVLKGYMPTAHATELPPYRQVATSVPGPFAGSKAEGSLAHRLRAARVAKHADADFVAKQARVSPAAVRQAEYGTYVPDAILQRICDTLGVECVGRTTIMGGTP